MQTAVVHDELSVAFPDSYHVMDKDEQLKAYVDDNPCRWCIKDADTRVMIAIFWHDSNKFLSKLVSTKSLAKRAEGLSKRIYRTHFYKLQEFFSKRICDTDAEGFAFEYANNGEAYSGQTIVFKHDACCYTLYWYAPKESGGDTLGAFEAIIESLCFI